MPFIASPYMIKKLKPHFNNSSSLKILKKAPDEVIERKLDNGWGQQNLK